MISLLIIACLCPSVYVSICPPVWRQNLLSIVKLIIWFEQQVYNFSSKHNKHVALELNKKKYYIYLENRASFWRTKQFLFQILGVLSSPNFSANRFNITNWVIGFGASQIYSEDRQTEKRSFVNISLYSHFSNEYRKNWKITNKISILRD